MSDELDPGIDSHAASHDPAQAEDARRPMQSPRMSAETLQAAKKVLGRLTADGPRQAGPDTRH